MNLPRKIFFVIENGERVQLTWENQQAFVDGNLKMYAFGDRAIGTACPIKGVFTFTDGKVQGMRGDRYTGHPVYMVRNLVKIARKYIAQQLVTDIKIYDNRALLPVNTQLILHWTKHQGMLLNYLPVFSGEYDLDRPKLERKWSK